MGTAVAVIYDAPAFPGDVIPAYLRKISGGKYTLNGTPLPLPLSVSISGPTTINWGVDATWNANASGGAPSYHYQWWYKYPGGIEPLKATPTSKSNPIQPNLPASGYWNQIRIDSPTLTRHDYKDHYLKCVVTDADNTAITSNIIYITVSGGSAPLSSLMGNNDLQQNTLDKSIQEEKVTEDKLFNNYPNPFNPSTVINFNLKSAGNVTLKIYNVLGQEVAVLLNGFKAPGRYSIPFKAENLPSGIYIYKLVAGEFSAIGKMNLLK